MNYAKIAYENVQSAGRICAIPILGKIIGLIRMLV